MAQGAVDERGAGFGQADDDRAGVILGLAASQQTARFQARHQPAERGLAERDRFQQRTDPHLLSCAWERR